MPIFHSPRSFSRYITHSDKTLRYSKRRKMKRKWSLILEIEGKLENEHTNGHHVIPAVYEAHIEDQVVRCLPLANKWNVSLQILGYCRSPANEKPKDYQENNSQHPHHSPPCHVWNTLSSSGQEYLQNPEKFRQRRIKKSTSCVTGTWLSFYFIRLSDYWKKLSTFFSLTAWKGGKFETLLLSYSSYLNGLIIAQRAAIIENISYVYVRDTHSHAVLSSCFVPSSSQWKTYVFGKGKVVSIKQ